MKDLETSGVASLLPPQSAFYHAILVHLSERPNGDARENIHAAMPEILKLSETQRTERLRNLGHLRYRYRSGWGLSMLKSAGYLDSPARGIWRMTDRGRQLLAAHPHGFNNDVGRQIMRESRKGREPESGDKMSTEAL